MPGGTIPPGPFDGTGGLIIPGAGIMKGGTDEVLFISAVIPGGKLGPEMSATPAGICEAMPCIYLCVCVCMHARVHVCIRACLRVCVYIHMYVYIHVCKNA
jgi:hypothetical protein